MDRDLVRQLVEWAEANEIQMDGTTDPVRRIIAANDVVWGVWNDPKEPHGVGLYLIKGRRRIQAIAHGAENAPAGTTPFTLGSQAVTMTGIKCADGFEQAVECRKALVPDE